MWTVLAAGILTFFSTCKTGSQARNNNTDTSLLYKKDTLLITGNVPAVLPFHFSANTRLKYNSRLKTLLLLENPTLVMIPEGVYEVYITSQPPDVPMLSSSQPGFLTVLDLYSLTAPTAGNRLELDISGHIKKLFLLKQPLPVAYISIRFGPVKLPDGSYSAKAGELRLTGIRIVQINN